MSDAGTSTRGSLQTIRGRDLEAPKIKSVAVRNEKLLGRVCARKLQRALNFRERFEGRKGGVKATLMNQNLLAAIGNTYSDEILLQAQLHPRASVAHLDAPILGKLHTEVRRLLKVMIEWEANPWEANPHKLPDPSCSPTGAREKGVRRATVKSGRAKPQDKPPTTACQPKAR